MITLLFKTKGDPQKVSHPVEGEKEMKGDSINWIRLIILIHRYRTV
jgi:hypothetical protein